MAIAKPLLTSKRMRARELIINNLLARKARPGLHFRTLAEHAEVMRQVVEGKRRPIDYAHELEWQFILQGWYPEGFYERVMWPSSYFWVRTYLDGYYIDDTDWTSTPDEFFVEKLQECLDRYELLVGMGFSPADQAVLFYPRWEINVHGLRIPSGPRCWMRNHDIHVLAKLKDDEYAQMLLEELPEEAYTLKTPSPEYNFSINIEYVKEWTGTGRSVWVNDEERSVEAEKSGWLLLSDRYGQPMPIESASVDTYFEYTSAEELFGTV